MPSFRSRRRGLSVVLALTVLALAASAEAPSWIQWLPASSPASSVLYRIVPGLAGPVPVRRPPAETAPELARMSEADPSDPELMRVAALEYEAQLDFENAEIQWRRFAEGSEDGAAGRIALADYYHRRLEPDSELDSLVAAATALEAREDLLIPQTEERAWMLHERIQTLIETHMLPVGQAVAGYEAWLAQYPAAADVYQRYFDFLTDRDLLDPASDLLERYRVAFPGDAVFPVQARASLAREAGSARDAVAVYDAAFDPLWPRTLLVDYFRLLRESRTIFEAYQERRRQVLADPLDLEPVAWLFHYYRRSQSDRTGALRELAEFRLRRESAGATWEAVELETLARLADSADDHDEAIRYAYALYSLPGADAEEAALVQMISTLLAAPDQPIRFGRGDLSFYRDIATIDASPGFLNGILSLIFNSRSPDGEFASQQRKSEAYFHRATADALYGLLSERFPDSVHRSELLSGMIAGYARYGEDAAIIRRGTAFIDEFADAPQRTDVALQVADAYARSEETVEELAIYDRLLAELGRRADQLPIGNRQPRSPDYARVLQRYISRLTQLERIPDAVALYRQEIERNPLDPGLYDRLADFLGANRRSEEVEAVYRQAIARFQDTSWWHKLARYYLRNRRARDMAALSGELVDAFSGSEVEGYISDVVTQAPERSLQVEINRYALERFPHDLRFVHNLVDLYSGAPTANTAELMRLLSEHWYEDEVLRRRYFERLSAGGDLAGARDAARAVLGAPEAERWEAAETFSPVLTRFLAEAEAWQSHFEEAGPVMEAVGRAYPTDLVFAGRASDLHRSLAAYDPSHMQVAVSLVEDLARSDPRNRDWPIRIGDIYAENALMDPAIEIWTRLPGIEPGSPDGYLETATLFWDYLRAGDALDWLERGRTTLGDSTLWAYETGAVLESLGRPSEAVQEYVIGARGDRSGPPRARLMELATRSGFRDTIEALTDAEDARTDIEALRLRVSVLEAQDRQPEIDSLLEEAIDRTSSREILTYARQRAGQAVSASLEERAIRREIEIEADPEEQLRLRIELAGYLESRDRLDAARSEIESLYADHPLISGVVRATVDFHWRHDQERAVGVLERAADEAYPGLRPEYLAETARKAIDAGMDAEATAAVEALLRLDPLDPRAIALMADALTAGGRDDDAREFYASKISEISEADLPGPERTDRIAAMRQGLIPVLVRDGRYGEALDQFIEIVNRYPDEEAVLREAGRHALDYGLESDLIDYYARTAEASPRDPRWPIILARLHTQFEDYPAAIAAYGAAMGVRPERMDLAEARAGLEERTFRFEDAIRTYRILYELSRQEPVWLERIASLEIRLGRNEDAIANLRRAYIEDRPEAAREHGRAAVILESHGMIEAAAELIAEQRLNGRAFQEWVPVFARIMTAARRYPEALDRVLDLENDEAARAMGRAVASYFTPEERFALATLLDQRMQTAREIDRSRLMEVARGARLHGLEAEWLLDEARRVGPEARQIPGVSTLTELEQRRLRFRELALELEELARTSPVNARSNLLRQAQFAYQAIGDTDSELRLLEANGPLQVTYRARYYELLAEARPDELVERGARSGSAGLVTVRSLIAAGERERAVQAIGLQSRTPVWRDAYTGLVNIYFGADIPEVRPVFEQMLVSPLVQDRLGRALDRDLALAGELWFYYGQRYGEYLADRGQADALDYLSSQVELRPRDPEAYLELARYYRETGAAEAALLAFRQTLELDPIRPGVHSEIAALELGQGRRDEALDSWRRALEAFEQRPAPATGAGIIRDIRSHSQAVSLRSELEDSLEFSAGTFEVWDLVPLLQAAFEESAEDAWLMEVVAASRAPGQLLTNLSTQPWLTPGQRGGVLQAAVQDLSTAPGASQVQYRQVRQRYLDHLIEEGRTEAASEVLRELTTAERRTAAARRAEIRIAAADGSLPRLIDLYRDDASEAPGDQTLQAAAAVLESQGLATSSRQLREYLYTRQIDRASMNTTAFLGLAEIRLEEGRIQEAVDLLERLNLLSVTPFDQLTASARLLADHDQAALARQFLELRVRALPWDAEARVELARSEIGDDGQAPERVRAILEEIVASSEVPYDIRAAAARTQSTMELPPTGLAGSRELDLLSGRVPLTSRAASASGFFAVRLAAADEASDAEERLTLLLGAIAERPNDPDLRKRVLGAALDTGRYHLARSAYRGGGGRDLEINTDLGEASFALGEFAAASGYFRTAASQEQDPERRAALELRETEAQAAYERVLEDERRRPVMREDLDQPNVVRERQP